MTVDQVMQLKLEQQHLRAEDVTEAELEQLLSYPDSFGYFGDKDIAGTWALGPVVLTRDSEVLTKANRKALENALEADTKLGLISTDDYTITGCSHWAVGWVDHLSFRAVDEDGEPTDMCRWVMRWVHMLEEYPVADDSIFSEMEWEASLDTLENYILRYQVKLTEVEGQLPENYISEIHSALEHAPISEGYSWPIEEVKAIALAKGWLACEECEGDGWVCDPNGEDGNETLTCAECNGTGAQKKVEV